jgi:hypothetical protein
MKNAPCRLTLMNNLLNSYTACPVSMRCVPCGGGMEEKSLNPVAAGQWCNSATLLCLPGEGQCSLLLPQALAALS